eukprot:3675758-Alexandrium_andersonii.AAC.1
MPETAVVPLRFASSLQRARRPVRRPRSGRTQDSRRPVATKQAGGARRAPAQARPRQHPGGPHYNY